MRLFYTLLVFAISLQLAAYLLQAFQIIPNENVTFAFGPAQITDLFSMEKIGLLLSGGAAIGLAGLLLRQSTYAFYAMLLWAIGVMVPIVNEFFLAIPNFINALPIPASVSTPIYLVIGTIVAFAAFMFFIELATQRNVT